MNELPQAQTMTSLEIAELTGKQHKNVLRDIDVMITAFKKEEPIGSNLSRLEWHCQLEIYTDSRGRLQEMFRLDKDTTLVLLSGYDVVARLKIVKRWQQLEAQTLAPPAVINPNSISRREMALMILDAEDKIQALSQEVEELETVVVSQAKKVAFVDNVLTAKNCWTTTSIAKDDLGMSAIRLNQILKELGIQFLRDEHWVLKSHYENKGYTQTETFPYKATDGSTRTSRLTKWTELGRAFVIKQVTDHQNRQQQIAIQPTLPGQSATA